MPTLTHIKEARKRLRGTWRSDRTRTVANWVFPKRLAAKKYKWFASIFGKNTWHFGLKLCSSSFENRTAIGPYKILWANEYSAVVLFTDKEREKCHHLFFDGDHFYLVAGRAGNAEYFKRMPSNRSLQKRTRRKRRAAELTR